MRHEVPYDPARHGGLRAAEPLPDPEALGDWALVEPLLPRLSDCDQDVVEMLTWGASRLAIELLLGVTEAALSMRIHGIRLRIQRLLAEPPWDRDAVLADLSRLPGCAREPGIPLAWADWLWGPRSAAWYGRARGVHQNRMCWSWLRRGAVPMGGRRRQASRWSVLADATRAAIRWRQGCHNSIDMPGLRRGVRWSPALGAAVREVLERGSSCRSAAARHGAVLTTVMRAVQRARWDREHMPVWAVRDDPWPDLEGTSRKKR